ncbi:sporulation protein [Paenibacillus flagellatus]|uniref:Sporulation protein SpoOM n=1 Tax=Paenibacillus flagellatus TaxID=2211139 RepID=A0A2V5K1Q8_9BACL|nr:sporulation protein [Paenibacillus flagellatus]PYI53051.1 sporulation protein SpoOM [Paenibacillus flagellatus]
MSFFKKMMASVGIGGVKVNAVPDNADGVRVGDELHGTIYVKGGNLPQEITRIHLYLYSNYFRERDGQIVEESDRIAHYHLDEHFTIEPGEEREFSFAFPIPLSTPITIGSSKVWLVTELDVEKAIDQRDKDYIHIQPHPIVGAVFEALAQLGLRAHEVSLMHVPRLGLEFPFVQEFELKPQYRSNLEELELFYVVGEDEVEFFMEIDRRARGLLGLLEEQFDLDERFVRFTLTYDDTENMDGLIAFLKETIEDNL